VSARSKARKRALDILFEADQRGLNAQNLLADRLSGALAGPTPGEYTIAVVEGVIDRWQEINDLLATYSQGWTIERMPGVDRAILRIGAWEIVWNDEVPDPVAIAEAVQLARTLSTDESPSFVNGLLARLVEVKPTLV